VRHFAVTSNVSISKNMSNELCHVVMTHIIRGQISNIMSELLSICHCMHFDNVADQYNEILYLTKVS